MSVYTNDIDTLRQFVSQSFPQILNSAAIVTSVFVIMLYYSFWMTLAIVAGVVLMIFVVRKYAGNSASADLTKSTRRSTRIPGWPTDMRTC